MHQKPPHKVGTFEIESVLGPLLDRVQLGEVIVITRHGTPVARLVPFHEATNQDTSRAAAERLRHFGEQELIRLPKGMTIRDLIEEGRM